MSDIPDQPVIAGACAHGIVGRCEICVMENELSTFRTAGIIEIAVRNPAVAEYMRHWEGRAEKAERECAELREQLRHPTDAECYAAGKGPGIDTNGKFHEGGLPDTPDERARFEAYMNGHCWYVFPYDEELKSYSEIDTRRLYGVWRDRGSLPTCAAAILAAKQCPTT